MIALEWEDKFSVGVNEIDDQHKRLFSFINEVREAIKAGKSGEIVTECIQKLDDYASYHFSLEEKYMEEYHYPYLSDHIIQHKEFIQKVDYFRNNLDPVKYISAYNILEFLINWITFHILESDKEYSYYIEGKK